MRRTLAGLALLSLVLLSPSSGSPREGPAAGAPAAARRSCWPGQPGTDPGLCPPDDPEFARHWEFSSRIPEGVDRSKIHPAELALGSAGICLDAAWQRTIGRHDVVIAVLDSGILWDHRDLRRKVWLNAGELPPPEGSPSHDANGDGVFDVEDYAGDPRVADGNGNGLLDAGDLILAFSDCRDDDANGYPDDIAGYDFSSGSHCGFAAGDNDPADDTRFGHGTAIASTAAAETDNGLEDAGVCPRCRVLPVRVADTFVVDANRFARGVAFAVRSGAAVVASALGSYNNTPAARFAVDLAYASGVPVVGSAADEFSYHHNFPSVYEHAIYVNAIRFNHADDPAKASTFWGLSPCTNFGARVSLTVPATSCSSGATSRLAGVLGLLESAAREAGLGDLAAEEAFQVLRATADDLDNTSPDWGGLRYRALPGFDQLTGHGRVNALRAVEAVEGGRIPPEVDLAGPGWFDVVSPVRTPRVPVSGSVRLPRARSAAWKLEYALGVEPREEDYHAVAGGTVSGSLAGVLGVLDFARHPAPGGPPPRDREERDRYSVTLRLRATDDRGLTGEARRSFFVLHDPTWKAHFPVNLGASGEAAPVLADLDGDGRDEIVIPTSDGYLRILRWEQSGIRTVRAPLDRTPPVDPSGRTARPDEAAFPRETVIREAAIGDVFGDGRPVIVVASREGKVYAFDARGERLGAFPVSTDAERARPATATQRIESGILSRPLLVDLDGRPGLEIVVTSLDGHLYAWRADARALPGFPVRIEDPRLGPGHRQKIVSSPAAGDVDGDGRPEIVFGSNGGRDGLAHAWAVQAKGNLHPGGPFLPGWRPLEVPALRADLIPTLASGVQMTPALVDADGDGDQEVVLYAVTGPAILLVDHSRSEGPRVVASFSMSPGETGGVTETSFAAETGSPLVADADGDGAPELYAPLLPLRMLTLRAKPGVPLDVPLALGAWRVPANSGGGRRVPMLPTYPRRMEDLMIFARPAAADVDGDGAKEILMGSGGYLLHAFRSAGGEAAGFPKFTGGWIFSEPATGDLDGDGRIEVVTVTREGWLFAWETEAGTRGASLGRPRRPEVPPQPSSKPTTR